MRVRSGELSRILTNRKIIRAFIADVRYKVQQKRDGLKRGGFSREAQQTRGGSMKCKFGAFVIALAITQSAIASNFCTEFVRTSMYNNIAIHTAQDSYYNFKNEICTAYKRDHSRGSATAAGFSIPDLFSGSGNISESDSEAIATAMCSDTETVTSLTSASSAVARYLDYGSIRVAQTCAEAEVSGLKSETRGWTMVRLR